MKIFVTAKPNSREEKVEQIDSDHFKVSVKEAPIQGMANDAIIKALSEYFKVPKSNVKIIFGHTSRQKIIDIST